MLSINFQVLVLQPQQPSLAAGRLWASCSRVTLSMYWLITSSSPVQKGREMCIRDRYWVVYLVWFFWLDLTIKDPKYIIHSPLDDSIPRCV